jgi:hypothetical protein
MIPPRCQHPRAAWASFDTPNNQARCKVCFRVVHPVTCRECSGEGEVYDKKTRQWKRCLACDRGVTWLEPADE